MAGAGTLPPHLPRIAIAGLGIESSTFSPALTSEAAFHAQYGAAVYTSYPFLSPDSSLRQRAIWIPTLTGHSLPGGAVTRAAYESLVNKTLDSLRKHLPYDGLFFDIHGAMSVVGLDDPEGASPKIPISSPAIAWLRMKTPWTQNAGPWRTL